MDEFPGIFSHLARDFRWYFPVRHAKILPCSRISRDIAGAGEPTGPPRDGPWGAGGHATGARSSSRAF